MKHVLFSLLLLSCFSYAENMNDAFSGILLDHAQNLKQGVDDSSVFISQLTKLADKNHRESQYILGTLGVAGKISPKETIKRLHQAESNGCAGAAGILGFLYMNGQFSIKNEDIGFSWMLNAAERGDLGAQLVIAGMYYSGSIFVKKDLKKAYSWLYQASLSEEPVTAPARVTMIFIEGELEPEDIQHSIKEADKRIFSVGGFQKYLCAHSIPL